MLSTTLILSPREGLTNLGRSRPAKLVDRKSGALVLRKHMPAASRRARSPAVIANKAFGVVPARSKKRIDSSWHSDGHPIKGQKRSKTSQKGVGGCIISDWSDQGHTRAQRWAWANRAATGGVRTGAISLAVSPSCPCCISTPLKPSIGPGRASNRFSRLGLDGQTVSWASLLSAIQD